MITVLRERVEPTDRAQTGRRSWPQQLDPFTRTESRTKLIEGLVFNAFDALPDGENQEAVGPPTAGTILARVCGAWVGSLLGEFEPMNRGHQFARQNLRPLLRVVHKCIRVDSRRVEYHYLAGALLCLADDPDRALAAFRTAESLEGFASVSVFYAEAEAETELGSSALADGMDMRGARYAALLARALNISGERSRESLKQHFESNEAVRWLMTTSASALPTWVVVARQLLEP
jgi:hypothetical protein